MRKIMMLVVLLSFAIQPQAPAEAKVNIERIVITSPALPEELIVDDNRWVSLLGGFNLQDPRLKLDKKPVDIDMEYEIQRQFAGEDNFTTLDSFEYYPSTTGQGGYIHFRWHLGKENSLSDQLPGDWYDIHPEAELAINHILNSQHLSSHLIAYDASGRILLLEPQSMEIEFTLDTQQENWIDVLEDSAALDGKRLFIQTNSGGMLQQNIFDLSVMESCSMETSAVVMPTLDGNHLLFRTENTLEVREAETYELKETIILDSYPNAITMKEFGGLWDESTQQLEFVQLDTLAFGVPDTDEFTELKNAGAVIETIGTRGWHYYFYPRLETRLDEVDGGIFSTTNNPDAPYKRFQPGLDFQQVIMAAHSLYALEASDGDGISTIYHLDINTGEILNSVDIPSDVYHLGFEVLDTAALTTESVITSECHIALP